MATQSHNPNYVHPPVSRGGKSPPSKRRAGITLARPGHFKASVAVKYESRKAAKRAVHAKISTSTESNTKD
jgi:hypothetical protein